MPDEVINTFSREFIEGMTGYTDKNKKLTEERRTLLGDVGKNDSANWLWGNNARPVDCVIMLYAKDKMALNALHRLVFTISEGVEIKPTVEPFETKHKLSKEHFGFRDGISQPLVEGLGSKSEGAKDEDLVNPGEFILGYLNEYGSYSPSPYVNPCAKANELSGMHDSDKKDLGKNGTYLVFRQIEQHVEKFWSFLYQHSKEKAVTQTAAAVTLGAKMIGRWPDGQPLVTCPTGVCPITDDSLINFNYSVQDKYGINCPLGAHIRRTNPRDQVHTGRSPKDSLEMSKKHRMLRRGRIYGEPLAEEMNIEKMLDLVRHDKQKDKNDATNCNTEIQESNNDKIKTVRGLHFICLVSDIGRQFEFIQSVWANTSTFGDLCNEVDPVISPRPTPGQPHCHEFTTPQEIIRNRYKNVPEFTTVVGGAYFFMPGIKALKYIMKQA